MVTHATIHQLLDITNLLKEVCEKIDDHAVYKPDWSDAAVAAKVGAKTASVYRVRHELYGKLQAKQATSLEDRVTQIEEYLTRINKSWRD